VPLNCGALPDALIETELFGCERGAFTDARHSRAGLAAFADGGSLFLDEIDSSCQGPR
jgi:transcriptional regulator with PAS, ATPase and Fis domain